MKGLAQRLNEHYHVELVNEDMTHHIGHWEFMTPYKEHYTIEVTYYPHSNLLELFGDVEAHTEYHVLDENEVLEALNMLIPQHYTVIKHMEHMMYEAD